MLLTNFAPERMYTKKKTRGTEVIHKWYHRKRINDFVDLIDTNGGIALSAACGEGDLESAYLDSIFDEVIGLDIERSHVIEAREKEIETVQASVPPIPFSENSFDVVISISSVEHFPDERGFIEEVTRVLRPGGSFFLNFPIEVGFGGLLRFLGKEIVHPTRWDTPNNWRRFFDYSLEELFKNTPRNKHGTSHRYYNYTYLKDDLHELFGEVEISPWPMQYTDSVNLAFFAKATDPLD